MKKPMWRIVAWGNNYNEDAKKAFADTAADLRENSTGVDPGLKNGELLFDVSINIVRQLLQKKLKQKKVMKPDRLFELCNSEKFLEILPKLELDCKFNANFLINSAQAFLQVCIDHKLCISLVEYSPNVDTRKTSTVFVTKIDGTNVYFNFPGQLLKYNHNYVHIATMTKEIYDSLKPGDHIEVIPDESLFAGYRFGQLLHNLRF